MGKQSKYKLVKGVTNNDIKYIMTNLRQYDIDELKACGRKATAKQMIEYIKLSKNYADVAIVMRDNEPLCLMGAVKGTVPEHKNMVYIWMLATTFCTATEIRCGIMKIIREYLDLLNSEKKDAYTHVWENHRPSIKMLIKLGFEIEYKFTSERTNQNFFGMVKRHV